MYVRECLQWSPVASFTHTSGHREWGEQGMVVMVVMMVVAMAAVAVTVQT
jgi:hypothetical protein